jgi:hypothetical protein
MTMRSKGELPFDSIPYHIGLLCVDIRRMQAPHARSTAFVEVGLMEIPDGRGSTFPHLCEGLWLSNSSLATLTHISTLPTGCATSCKQASSVKRKKTSN